MRELAPVTWEALTAISTFATFIVIAASAVAAIMQLRHMNAGNQINAAMNFMEKWQGTDYARAIEFVFDGGLDEKLNDPAFRKDLERPAINRGRHPESAILGYWEQVGSLVKLGFVDEKAFLDIGSLQCINAWKKLEPLIAIMRRARGPSVFDNFEFLASRAMQWEARHGNEERFPRGTPHLTPRDLWPEDAAAATANSAAQASAPRA